MVNHTTRLSNMELLRIIAMICIVLCHTNFFILGGVTQEEIYNNTLLAIFRSIYQQLCMVGVNVFILISGYFGIRPSLKKVASLMFTVLFWGLLCLLIDINHNCELLSVPILKVFWGGGYYWFIPAYLGLFILSPIINTFIESVPQKSFRNVLFSFFFLEFLYGWLGNMGSYCSGHSIVSFLGLYMLGRYIRLYKSKLFCFHISTDIFLYLLLSLIPALLSIFTVVNYNRDLSTISDSSPFVVFAAMFLMLAFTKFSFESKAVNWVASSVFAIYVFHLHPSIVGYFKDFFLDIYAANNLVGYIVLSFCSVIAFGFVIVLIDKIRIKVWDICYSLFLKNWRISC